MKKLIFLLLLSLVFPLLAQGATYNLREATNIEDTYIEKDVVDNNFGSKGTLSIEGTDDYLTYSLIAAKNVGSSLPVGATISAATCSIKCTNYGGSSQKFYVYRVLQLWKPGIQNNAECADSGATWKNYDCPSSGWLTAGCGDAQDLDDGLADRWATPEDSFTVTATGWKTFSVTPALAQSWYAGTNQENGVIIISADADLICVFASVNNTVVANRPSWVFTYTVPSTSTRRPALIKKMLK